MFIPLSDLLSILEHYKYIVIFPIMIVEGPIITIISGFLSYLGFLNIYIVFPILVVGDLIGDCIYYSIGKYGRRVSLLRRVGYFMGYNKKSREFLKGHFEKHTVKTLLIAKISHGLGAVVQVSAGMSGLSFVKYFWIEFLGTVPKTFILLVIGVYLGGSYITIDKYLNSIASIIFTIFFLVVLYLLLGKYIKNALAKD